MNRTVPALLAVLVAAVLLPTTAAHAAGSAGTYIVRLAGDPISATRETEERRLDAHSTAAQKRGRELDSRRVSVLASVPSAKKLYDYQYTFNGFAATMSAAAAASLARHPQVLSVSKDEIRHLDTISTPEFLGLGGADGAWRTQFGSAAEAGAGVVIGMVDTGIAPDSPSFAALPEPRPDAAAIARKWHGSCVGLPCTNKIIGARWYRTGTPAAPGEYDSPRDFDGHGTHTASTAAGRADVPAIINRQPVGRISGMAPAARIAVYKVCWGTPAGGSNCSAADSVAAIDQAVADGVDVLNYSVSGSATSDVDPVSMAFYNAAAAGVFIAASAGNSGLDGASTSAHNAPWITTVAASTHDRRYEATATLGNGTAVRGVGSGRAVPAAPLVLGGTCDPGRLDPARVTGAVVLCDRGETEPSRKTRTARSREVARAGGVGMLLLGASASADFPFVPTIGLGGTAGATVREYLRAAAAPTVALAAGERLVAEAPAMAPFSAKGPGLLVRGDILKPDLTAPGVDVVAATSPEASGGDGFAALSGTSMSSPHVAGLGALLLSRNPRLGPMAVKSALMTTAGQLDNRGVPIQRDGVAADPFDFGAGHVAPAKAFDPGLVYDSNRSDWLRFLCATDEAARMDCAGVRPADPSDLNYPSIAVGDLPGVHTVTRRVTNVAGRAARYRAEVTPPPGFDVAVTPSVLRIAPGATATFTVRLTRTGAAWNTFQFGSLTWRDDAGHAVRSPLVLRAAQVRAPAQVLGTGPAGGADAAVDTAFAGTVTATLAGLTPATVTALPLAEPDGADFDVAHPAEGPHVGKVTVAVGAGTPLARFATRAGDYPAGVDVDLYVYKLTADGPVRVATSGGPDADEAVSLLTPDPGTYEVYVNLFAGPADTTVRAYTWALAAGPANATVSPASRPASLGGHAVFRIAWSELVPGTRYLGYLAYGDGTAAVGGSQVLVDG